MAERSTSDHEFVKLFAPQMIEQLDDAPFGGGVHIFRSPPGGGKTTLLRAFTPSALRAFWNSRTANYMGESYRRLRALNVLDEQRGPRLLGVFLSCASGYADLPPSASHAGHGVLRALLNTRVVIRALRSLTVLLGLPSMDDLDRVELEYRDPASDLKEIPLTLSATDLAAWAADWERRVYADIDSLSGTTEVGVPHHNRFEGVLWLDGVRFRYDKSYVALSKLLLVDDLHTLRRKQRALVVRELTELRPGIPVWLAERSIALGEQLLSQGARAGRDLHEYALEDIWKSASRSQFTAFAQNILERRLAHQEALPASSFSTYLKNAVGSGDFAEQIHTGIADCIRELDRFRANIRYRDWIENAQQLDNGRTPVTLKELLVTQILLSREDAKRQLQLELGPLSSKERMDRGTSQVQAAAEVFGHERFGLPYYYGIDRLCTLATNNVEELLSLAAALYEALLAKQILRKELLLSAQEQERLVRDVAEQRRAFIPKNHTEGTRAQRLLDAIGGFCREKTFLPNAPYAPGVTGIRLSDRELETLGTDKEPLAGYLLPLRQVLAECVAENLLFTRHSSESGSRERGTVFYLNRTLCAYYGLPLQLGGWQDVAAEDLLAWMNRGRTPRKNRRLEVGH